MRSPLLLALALAACAPDDTTGAAGADVVGDPLPAPRDDTSDTGPSDVAPSDTGPVEPPDALGPEDPTADPSDVDASAPPSTFVAVTFNTGTSGSSRPASENAGFGPEQAAWSDTWYGNGIAWTALIDDTRAFLDRVAPDIVVFQEVFHPETCPDIPTEARAGFVCETWRPGDPTVAQRLVGEGFQVMCHPGKPDKCAAVRRTFGHFEGCDADLCLEGMQGFTVEGCGRGARVARATIAIAGGGSLDLVHVHGSSGFTSSEFDCRTRQFDQIFVDLGDGRPGARGEANLVLGDFNTDPGRLAAGDPSAARLLEHVGTDRPFRWYSEIGRRVTPTYAGLFNIDHAFGDLPSGSCVAAGIDPALPGPTSLDFFDHAPLVCTIERPHFDPAP